MGADDPTEIRRAIRAAQRALEAASRRRDATGVRKALEAGAEGREALLVACWDDRGSEPI